MLSISLRMTLFQQLIIFWSMSLSLKSERCWMRSLGMGLCLSTHKPQTPGMLGMCATAMRAWMIHKTTFLLSKSQVSMTKTSTRAEWALVDNILIWWRDRGFLKSRMYPYLLTSRWSVELRLMMSLTSRGSSTAGEWTRCESQLYSKTQKDTWPRRVKEADLG